MPLPSRRRFLRTASRIVAAGPLAALAPSMARGTDTPPPATRHFLIVFRIAARLHDEKAWTAAEQEVLRTHYNYLKDATDAGQVLLAGRTDEPLDRAFAIVVFTANDEAAARRFMENDPCFIAGVMQGELHPYRLALFAGKDDRG